MNYIYSKPFNFDNNNMIINTLDINFTQNREIIITDEINAEKAEIVCSALRLLARDSHDDITLYINSPGGSVSAGFAIHDTIKNLPCDVITVASGTAASMAAFLVSVAGTQGKRYIKPNAEMLIHQPLSGVSGQASDIAIHASHVLKIKNKLNTMLAQATGQPVEKINLDTDRDYIMDAKESQNYGLVDIIGCPFEE